MALGENTPEVTPASSKETESSTEVKEKVNESEEVFIEHGSMMSFDLN
jgi:hypothetical protein